MPPTTRELIERRLATVQNAQHRKLLESYMDERLTNGIRETTLLTSMSHLVMWSQQVGSRKFEEATKADVQAFVSARVFKMTKGKRVSAAPSKAYVNQRKNALRLFQRWVRGGGPKDDYPAEVAWLVLAKSEDDDRVLEQVITREELKQLIDGQTHPQDRAILAVLYDSGMRKSEFLSLKISDVLLDEFGAVLRLRKGALGLKTGARHVRIIHSVPYLTRWMNDHPLKTKGEAPLWMGRSPRSFMQSFEPKSFNSKVKDMAARAGVTRNIWPHLFRHSRATEAVKEGMSESEMRIYFGWRKDSEMPTHYSHIGGKDVDEAILRRAGKLKGGPRVGTIEARPCPRCASDTVATDDFCQKCRAPLTPKAAERAATDAVAAVFKNNPDLLRPYLEAAMRKQIEAEDDEGANA